MSRRRAALTLVWLICLSQLGADCAGGQTRYLLGYAKVAGRVAVYAPLCADDEVRGVRVYAAPEPEKDGDFTLLWQADGPTKEAVRGGLFLLGDDGQFTTVALAPPPDFPPRLSVEVDTAHGRVAAENRKRPADLPNYDADTPLPSMTFDTERGLLSAAQLRQTLTDQGACP